MSDTVESRRQRIVKDYIRVVLSDGASRLQATKNALHLDDANIHIPIQDISRVRTQLSDVLNLLDDYSRDPTYAVKVLLELED